MDDAKIAVIGNGTAGRIALSAVRTARAAGIPVGLLRPISLRPFPVKAIQEVAAQVDNILVVEMNAGMMLEDILKVVPGKDQRRVLRSHRWCDAISRRDSGRDPAHRRQSRHQLSGHPRDLWMERIEPVINQ